MREQEFASFSVLSIKMRPKNLRGLAERSMLITKAYQSLKARGALAGSPTVS